MEKLKNTIHPVRRFDTTDVVQRDYKFRLANAIYSVII